MKKGLAQGLMYGGACTALASAFAELAAAATWGEVLTPKHVFGFIGAVAAVAGALYHPEPDTKKEPQKFYYPPE